MAMDTLGLIAPPAYWLLTPAERKEICNGAGPKKFGWMVPDTMYGLCITPAADIHDYMYYANFAQSIADETFKQNLFTLIDNKGGWLRHLRRVRARSYFTAVHLLGRFFK